MNIKEILKKSTATSWELFKILTPVLIAVKICQELDIIKYLAIPLEPIMGIVGLPAEMGLVWAISLVGTIFAGIVVFISLVQDVPISVAQVTILWTMILIAHSLPSEVQIVGKAGAKRHFQIIFRLASAILLGAILNLAYKYFNYLQEPASIILAQLINHETYMDWAIANIKGLFFIFVIITVIIFMMEFLERIGVINIINKILSPIIRWMGISENIIPLIIVGITLGISCGGGLIIQEAKSEKLTKRDIFYAVSLLALCHSMIDDTLLVIAIGAHISGILWARLAFTFIMIMLLVSVVKRLPDKFCERFLWKK